MNTFNGKYRIDSTRMRNWDYAWKGSYFITICTANREYFFGDISNGKMKLSTIGKMVKYEWLQTFDMRTDMNLSCGAFVVMPNHFHALITIGKNDYNHPTNEPTKNKNKNNPKNKFGPQSKNLPSIVRGFKSAVTKNARQIHADFGWQPGYHDHMIRNIEEYDRIKNYIINNPKNWKKDRFR